METTLPKRVLCDRDPHSQKHASRSPFELPGFQNLPENDAAVQAIESLLGAIELQESPPFCPLFLYGQTGTGKTQLATAMLGVMAEGATGRCVPVRELARPDELDTDSGFADPDLVECNLLILEDVQHLPEKWSGAMCELIDRRASFGLALVVTSKKGPADLTHLPRRLTSRLAAGLVVQLEPLGGVSRRAILAAAATKIQLAPEALDWLAEQRGGIRAALGQLQTLAARAHEFPRMLDRRAVQDILQESGVPGATRTELHAIVERVCAAFEVNSDELFGTSRLRNVVTSRQVAMHLARERGGLSLAQIGSTFGRDHTTVLHACRRIEAASKQDAQLAATIRQLNKELA